MRSFKKLDRLLMFFSGFARAERAEVFPPTSFSVRLSGVQPVFAGFQFPNHTVEQAGFLP